jgi:hypothetical protein
VGSDQDSLEALIASALLDLKEGFGGLGFVCREKFAKE